MYTMKFTFFILLVLAALASISYADSETFNFPDLLVIPKGEAHVFPGAPNRNGKFDTIQKAINQLVSDGFTANSGLFATVIVHNRADGQFYTGDNPENEIHVPYSINIRGSGNGGRNPDIKTTFIMDNDGSAGAGYSISTVFWTLSNMNMVQPSPDKPVLISNVDPAQTYPIIDLFECFISSELKNATAPLVELYGFAWLLVRQSTILTISPEPVILGKEFSSCELYYSIVLCYRLYKHEGSGTGAITQVSYFWINWCEIGIDPGFLGDYNPPAIDNNLIEIAGPSIDFIGAWQNNFFMINPTSPNPVIMFKADDAIGTTPQTTPSMLTFAGNTIYFTPTAGGGDFLYVARNATLRTSNYQTFSGGVTSSDVAAIIDAVSI